MNSIAADKIQRPALGISRRGANSALLFLLAVALCVDMGGEYRIRNYVIAIAVPLLMGLSIARLRFDACTLFAFILLVVWPTASLVIGLANGADPSLAFSQLQSTILGFVLILVVGLSDARNSAKLLGMALRTTAVIAIVLAIGLVLDLPLVNTMVASLHDSGGGFFGTREGLELLAPNVYFKSSIFYVWAFTYTLLLNQRWWALIFMLAMVAAISKASLIAAFVVITARTLFAASTRGFVFFGLSMLAIVLIAYSTSLNVQFEEIVNLESNTVDVRMLHLSSLLSHWVEHPLSILFGFGLGTEFFSLGADGWVSNIELDHLNTIRKYGLFWSLVFFGWVFYSALWAIRHPDAEPRAIGWALLVVFFVAGTNPVLISPVFFFALAIAHALRVGPRRPGRRHP